MASDKQLGISSRRQTHKAAIHTCIFGSVTAPGLACMWRDAGQSLREDNDDATSLPRCHLRGVGWAGGGAADPGHSAG